MDRPADPTTRTSNYAANFDYIRLVAASAVIFSHAFLIAEGTEANEPITRLLGPWITLGLFAVLTFFVLSGYLITQSALNSSLTSFALKRVARIYPGMIICFFLCGLILGPLFTEAGARNYLTSLMPLKYGWNATLTLQAWDAPTVRFTPGPVGAVMNGVIWTIRHELFCYIALGVLAATRLLRPIVLILLSFIAAVMISYGLNGDPDSPEILRQALLVVPSFIAGALIFFATGKRPAMPLWPLLPCGVMLVIALWWQKSLDLFPLYAAYPLILLGRSRRFQAPSLRRIGDISYGTYLYGWPIEQVWCAIFGYGVSPYILFAASWPTALMMGYASWHLVEKHGLKLAHGHPAALLNRFGFFRVKEGEDSATTAVK